MGQAKLAAGFDAIGLRKRVFAAIVVAAALLPIGMQLEVIGSFLLSNVKSDKSGYLVSVDMFLHTLALAMAVWAIFSRRLSMTALAICLWAAWGLEKTNFFAGVLHPALIALQAYPDWFGYGNTVNQSNQYAKLFVSFLIVLVLAARIVRKRDRSIDRLYMTLIAGSVLATTLLFHWVTVQGVKAVRQEREVALRVAAEAPAGQFDALCKELHAWCLSGPISELPIHTGNARIDHMAAAISRGAEQQTSGFTFGIVNSQPLDDGADDRLNSFHIVYHRTPSGDYRFVIESSRTVATLKQWQGLYSALALPAHLTWLAGGLFLLYWHKRRMARRTKREIEIHDFVEKRWYEFIQG